MLPREDIEKQLQYTIQSVDLPGLGRKIEGKVRDCYVQGDKRILIASDRLSAFDVVLTTIPFKGQILTQLANYWFEATKHILQNHVISHPHPNVLVTTEVEILPIEVVVRGYLTGSAWRDYEAGKDVSGITLPKGLKKSQRFEQPIITPSTKAERGEHDMPISSEEIVRSEIVEAGLWQEVCAKALELFAVGTKKSAERGLILVDTKYEFGIKETAGGAQELVLADEIHTPDSSRYWLNTTYAQRFESGQDPDMMDKEFVRRYLIEQGYMGEGTPPELSDSFRVDTAIRYIEAYEKLTGEAFTAKVGPAAHDIKVSLSH